MRRIVEARAERPSTHLQHQQGVLRASPHLGPRSLPQQPVPVPAGPLSVQPGGGDGPDGAQPGAERLPQVGDGIQRPEQDGGRDSGGQLTQPQRQGVHTQEF